jgi:serine/threonine-protein phosphatase 2A regulatory subunit B''
LISPILSELFELRDEYLSQELEQTNWFSSYTILLLYNQYISADQDRNGMLNKTELGHFNHGLLTSAFVERLFQESFTFKGEMDYKFFLDLVLALSNRKSPQSIHYLFKILDIHGKGYLDEFSIAYYLKVNHSDPP